MNLNVRRRNAIDPEHLMSFGRIGKETANKILVSIFKKYTWSTDNLTWRFKNARVHSIYQHHSGPYAQFCTDTLFSRTIYLCGNTYGHVYFNKAKFYRFYPLKYKRDAHATLLPLIQLARIPEGIHSYRPPELIHGQFSSLL